MLSNREFCRMSFVFFSFKILIFIFYILEQYSLSHELRFQYINHVEAIRVPKIDDIKEMHHTQVCLLWN